MSKGYEYRNALAESSHPELATLLDFCLRRDLAIGDVLKALGVNGRDSLNDTIKRVLGNKSSHGKKRRFTGIQLLALATVYSLRFYGSITSKQLNWAYYGLISRALVCPDLTIVPMTQLKLTDGDTIYRDILEETNDPNDATFCAVIYDFPILAFWLRGILLMGCIHSHSFSIWRVAAENDTLSCLRTVFVANMASVPDKVIPPYNTVAIDVSSVLRPIAARLGLPEILPEIPEIGVYAFGGSRTITEAVLDISEATLLDAIRQNKAHKIEVTTSGHGRIQHIEFTEGNLPKGAKVEKVLGDPITKHVIVQRHKTTKETTYRRRVKYSFPT